MVAKMVIKCHFWFTALGNMSLVMTFTWLFLRNILSCLVRVAPYATDFDSRYFFWRVGGN